MADKITVEFDGEEAKKGYEELGRTAEQAADQQVKFGQAALEAKQATDQIGEAARIAGDSVKEVATTAEQAGETQAKAAEDTDRFAEEMVKASDSAKQLSTSLDSVKDNAEEAGDAVDGAAKGFDGLVEAGEHGTASLRAAGSAARIAGEEIGGAAGEALKMTAEGLHIVHITEALTKNMGGAAGAIGGKFIPALVGSIPHIVAATAAIGGIIVAGNELLKVWQNLAIGVADMSNPIDFAMAKLFGFTAELDKTGEHIKEMNDADDERLKQQAAALEENTKRQAEAQLKVEEAYNRVTEAIKKKGEAEGLKQEVQDFIDPDAVDAESKKVLEQMAKLKEEGTLTVAQIEKYGDRLNALEERRMELVKQTADAERKAAEDKVRSDEAEARKKEEEHRKELDRIQREEAERTKANLAASKAREEAEKKAAEEQKKTIDDINRALADQKKAHEDIEKVKSDGREKESSQRDNAGSDVVRGPSPGNPYAEATDFFGGGGGGFADFMGGGSDTGGNGSPGSVEDVVNQARSMVKSKDVIKRTVEKRTKDVIAKAERELVEQLQQQFDFTGEDTGDESLETTVKEARNRATDTEFKGVQQKVKRFKRDSESFVDDETRNTARAMRGGNTGESEEKQNERRADIDEATTDATKSMIEYAGKRSGTDGQTVNTLKAAADAMMKMTNDQRQTNQRLSQLEKFFSSVSGNNNNTAPPNAMSMQLARGN